MILANRTQLIERDEEEKCETESAHNNDTNVSCIHYVHVVTETGKAKTTNTEHLLWDKIQTFEKKLSFLNEQSS